MKSLHFEKSLLHSGKLEVLGYVIKFIQKRSNMQVIKSEDTPRGKSLQVKIKEKTLSIIFTWHVLDAIKEYRFSIEDVLNFLLNPEEVIKGHGGRLIAHRRLNSHLTRVVYELDSKSIVVVTFYKAHVQRYYRGGSYEDKILSGR